MKSLILALSLLALSLLAPCISAAAGFDLKGVEVGKHPSAANQKVLGETTLAGVKCDLNYFENKAKEIDKITGIFASSDFDTVNAAIFAKYGKPDRIEKETMRNGFGAQFERVIEIWINEQGDSMQVVNFLSATRAAVVIQAKSRIEAEAAATSKAKNDI